MICSLCVSEYDESTIWGDKTCPQCGNLYPESRVSSVADRLESGGSLAWGVSAFLAVILLIVSSIGVDKWGDTAFNGTGFFTGLIWAGAVLLTGYIAKLLLQGLAVIVEANYRSMRK